MLFHLNLDESNIFSINTKSGALMSQNVLLDKIRGINESQKKLNVLIYNVDSKFDKVVLEMCDAYNTLNYNVTALSDINDISDNSFDIFISLSDDFNMSELCSKDIVKIKLHMVFPMPQAEIIYSNSIKDNDIFLLESESPMGIALDLIDHIEYDLVTK